MTERNRDERKKLFAEIMGSLNEYSTEEIDDPEAAKSTILQLLKTHRAVKLADYEYGLLKTLIKNHRLIVKEPEDGSKVREYIKIGNKWYCINYSSRHNKCENSHAIIKYGICFAPIKHNDRCKAREYSFVMLVQNFLKQGKVKEAVGLAIHGKRSRYYTSSESPSSTLTLNESTFPHADQDDNSIAESLLPTTTVSPDVTTNLTPSSSSSPLAAEDTITQTSRSTVKREADNDDDDDCIIIDELAAKRIKIEEEPNNNIESFKFDRPSTYILKRLCEKLKIEYCNTAYKFWGDIAFQSIPDISSNIQTHSFKSPNIFACLSLLFTGDTESSYLIQHVINKAVREDFTTSGGMSKEEVEQILHSNTVYDEQVEFIASYLSCRIGLYYTGRLKKFGKWDHVDEEDFLTLILSFDGGLFSVVLDIA